MQPIDAKMEMRVQKKFQNCSFWKYNSELENLSVRFIVRSRGNYSDGEENNIPVLTNSCWLQKVIPIWVRAFQERIHLRNPKTTARQLYETNLR
jgi:hypothetical protein